ncbi:tRNA-aminoacylation cofactor ARC1 [Smittium mucronatum]|uniref:tRNA-aminoacylation cofactor ARC1 n=1 Tax=Smittium mucronatum TaxID=133383 RepID=A0A1R0H656_9FUNG|nr:tRNA-aminoacylation cofactor ARC1 [Smittium mucronatum]
MNNLGLVESSAFVPTSALGVNALSLQMALDQDRTLIGSTEEQAALISQYITMSGKTGTVNRQNFVQYLVPEKLTVADIVSYANLFNYVQSLSEAKKKNYPNFTSWFSRLGSIFKNEDLDFANLSSPQSNSEVAGVAQVGEQSTKQKQSGKQKKTPKDPSAKKNNNKSPQEPLVIVPSMIDMRVGKIIKVDRHPDADSLYLEQIEIGEENPRQVISGLVKYIPIDQMIDRTIIVICNLKPATMRGIKSYAMVLCADSVDGTKVEFVEPPAGSKPGDRVYFEGFGGQEPEALLNPKKKIWETIQPGFITSPTFEAGWVDGDKNFHRLMVNGNVCKSQSIAGGPMK